MAKSQKRKKTELGKIKNRLRGSETKFSTLAQIREIYPPRLLAPISQWSSGWLSALGIVASTKPSTFAKLNTTPFFAPISIDAELAWILGRLEKSIPTLREHVNLQATLEENILQDNHEDATKLVDHAFVALGVSMAWNAINIGLTQFYLGIEAQKKLVRQQRNADASRMAQFFAHWWSMRAEENMTFSHFRSEVIRRVKSWDIEQTDRAQIIYYLFNEVPSVGYEESLLAVASSSSAIDAYEMVVAISEVAAAEKRPIAKKLAPFLRRLSEQIEDFRLARLLLLLDSDKGTIEYTSVPCTYQSLELGKAKLPENPTLPSTPMELFAYFRLWPNISPVASSLYAELSNSIRELGSNPDTHAESVGNLKKIGLVLGALPLGRTIAAIARQNETGTPPFDQNCEVSIFANAKDSFIEACSCLSFRSAQEYEPHLLKCEASKEVSAAIKFLSSGSLEPEEVEQLDDIAYQTLVLRRAFKAEDFEGIFHISENLNRQSNSRLSTYANSVSRLKINGIENALTHATELIVDNSSFINWLPADALLHHVYSQNTNHLPDLIGTSIFLDVYQRKIDGSISSFTAYAAEDFLLERGLDQPTDLNFERNCEASAKEIYYLEQVCTAERLRFFAAFDSEQEVETERIDICLTLAKTNEDQIERYESEARSIYTGRLVKEALKELQASKISIDQLQLREWADKHLREDFARYQTYYESGLVPIGEQFKQSLISALETGSVPAELFDVPQNEAISLFRDMASRYIQQCAFDTEHGLDCYLSLRIRHGTLSGTLRSSAERENVVTRRSKETGTYVSNQHWRDHFLGILDFEDWEFVDDRLSVFSARLDEIISDLTTDYIQIKRAEKPSGLFEISVTSLQLYSVVADINSETTFDSFVDRLSELFWLSVQLELVKVRKYIDQDFRKSIQLQFDSLENDLRSDAPLRPLADAVLRAKNETELSVSQVRDWFELPAATSSLAFALEELVAVSMETLQRFHPGFLPQVIVQADGIPPFQSALNLFSDIFFVVFENVYKHCGMSTPVVRVTCEYYDRALSIRVTNCLAESVNVETSSEVLERARQQIQSDDFLTQVRKERGSGLPKLANLIGVRANQGKLDFGIDADQGEFWLSISIPATIIEAGGGAHAEIDSAD